MILAIIYLLTFPTIDKQENIIVWCILKVTAN